MKKIKKTILLVITLLFLLAAVNTAAATNVTVQNNISNLNATITNVTHENSTNNPINRTNTPNTVIYGQVTQCNGTGPFSGATVKIESLTGSLLATTTTDSNGQYSVSFYSTENSFKVTASYPGHVMPTKIVTVNPAGNDSARYGTANLKLGTLQLTKGSWDNIGLDSNKVTDGPNQFLIQVHVKNNAVTTATNVVSTLTFTTSNSYVNLAPNETNVKNLGNIAPGATVNVFYLVEITRNSAAYDTTRNYTITVAGDNTGTPADTISGQLYVQKLVSQNRNHVTSITANNTDPNLGDTIKVTVLSDTAASNYNVVNLPLVNYNPAILQPVSVTTTYNSNTISDVEMNSPGANSFSSVWVFKTVGTGTTSLYGFENDLSGGSYHYNTDYGENITVTVHPVTDLAVTKTAPATVIAGQQLTYTITVTNNGPASLSPTDTFTVSDTLPAGFSASSYIPSAGSYNPATGAWTGVTLASGQSVTLTISGTVIPTATGTLSNTATVTPPVGVTDPNSGNSQATVSTTVDGLPVAHDNNKTTPKNTPVSGNVPASDPDGPIAVLNFTVSGTTYTAGSSRTIPGVGTITVNVDGTYTFTPTTNYVGPVPPITYTVEDLTHNTAIGVITITVTPTNTAPVANNDAATTPEDISVTVPVLGNDTDVDGDALSIIGVTSSAHGTVVINEDGTVTYTPNADYNGLDNFTYTISDGNGGTATATVDITVTPVNDAPVANNDTTTTPEDTSVTIPVLSNDTDVDGDNLSVTGTTSPSHGTVTVNADGTITYTPNANYNGPDSFTYTISDGNGGTSTATVNVTVIPVNDAPVATGDSRITPEDTSVSGAVTATDVDGDSLTFSKATDPAHGTVVVNADGSYTYTPNNNYNGPDQFSVTVSDGHGGFDTVTVFITVTSVNDVPIAVDDSATTNEDTSVTIPVLGNDSDVDGDSLSVTGTTSPNHGTVTVNTDGTITYTPNTNYNGPDSFTYTISDGNGGTSTATVNINVTPVNDAPVAKNDTTTTPEDTSVTIPVLNNDTDVDGDTLSVIGTTSPAHGTVVINEDGTVTYTPNANYNGSDQFTYTISDGNGGSATATVSINVTPVNDAPVATVDSKITPENTHVSGKVTGNDADGDTLTFTLGTEPSHGTVVVNADGTYTYAPDANYHGLDSFTVTVSDGHGGSATATVDITVTPVNHAPVAVNDSANTSEDTPVTINVLNNDRNVEGQTLTVIAVTQPSDCTAVINADGTVTYTPDPGFVGHDSFTYTISDGHGGTATATVFITVTPVNNVPVAVNDTVNTTEATQLSGSVAGNDHRTAGDVYSLVSGPKHGTLIFHSDGTFTYTPDPNFEGVDSFVYMITDSSGHVSVATVTINVNEHAVNVNAVETQKETKKAIPMQPTGLPLAGLVLSVLAVFSGFIVPKRKN